MESAGGEAGDSALSSRQKDSENSAREIFLVGVVQQEASVFERALMSQGHARGLYCVLIPCVTIA